MENMTQNLVGLVIFLGIIYAVYKMLFAKDKVVETIEENIAKAEAAPAKAVEEVAAKVEEEVKKVVKQAAAKKPAAKKTTTPRGNKK